MSITREAHRMDHPDENDPDAYRADTDTARSLSLITVGRPGEFADHEEPPAPIQHWLRQANLRQVRGLLVGALRRWRLLRQR